jgi:hypothetical protein
VGFIELPVYFKELCHEETAFILITGIYSGELSEFSASEIKNNQFQVYSSIAFQSFFWLVKSQRRECNFEVEVEKNIEINGEGPYVWVPN